MTKTAEMGEFIDQYTSYLRLQILEDAFWRRLLTPKAINRSEAQRSVDHDELVVIKDIEPELGQVKAVVLNMKGGTRHVQFAGPRYEIPFFRIETEEAEIKEHEKYQYEMNIVAYIRERSEKEVATTEDLNFMHLCKTAVESTEKEVVTPDTTVTRKNLVKLFNLIDTDKLQTQKILMNLVQFNNILAWENSEYGSNLLGEVVVNGYKHTQLLGKDFLVSNDTNKVPVNEIWGFTDQKFMGHAFLLEQDLVFSMEKHHNILSFKSWEEIAVAIGNPKSVSRMKIAG
jgi:hypothetical protein